MTDNSTSSRQPRPVSHTEYEALALKARETVLQFRVAADDLTRVLDATDEALAKGDKAAPAGPDANYVAHVAFLSAMFGMALMSAHDVLRKASIEFTKDARRLM